MKSFALIGVGFMGKGIARNVIAKSPKGTTVHLCDTNLPALQDFVNILARDMDCSNVKISSDASTALRAADLVAMSLPSQSAAELVIQSAMEQQSTGNNKQSKVIVEHGTCSRAFVLQCHSKLQANGTHYLDAPVSGGPQGALAGTLSMMVGGDSDVLTSCRPLLATYASNILHMGPVGCGMAAKLVNQALVGVHAQAAVEAITIAQSMGLTDMTKLKQLLSASWGQSKVLDLVLADYLTAEASGTSLADMKTAAPLRNMQKDFSCIPTDGLPLVHGAGQAISTACSKGLQDAPFAALVNLLKEQRPL